MHRYGYVDIDVDLQQMGKGSFVQVFLPFLAWRCWTVMFQLFGVYCSIQITSIMIIIITISI